MSVWPRRDRRKYRQEQGLPETRTHRNEQEKESAPVHEDQIDKLYAQFLEYREQGLIETNEQMTRVLEIERELRHGDRNRYNAMAKEYEQLYAKEGDPEARYVFERRLINRLMKTKIIQIPPGTDKLIESQEKLVETARDLISKDEELLARLKRGEKHPYIPMESLDEDVEENKKNLEERIKWNERHQKGYYTCISCNYVAFDSFSKCPKCGAE
jgi:hypothetical protein